MMADGNYENWLHAQNVCVIGAGTMGSGIAAHLANLGFDVTLLDVNHDAAVSAFERAKAARPPHFYVPETAASIRLGGIAENLGWVSEADWVCEAIVEHPDKKKVLFSSIEPLLRPDAMISTNTSGLQISLLGEGLGETFRRRFMGTHFFNPPRYLKLLELIPTDETDPAAVAAMRRFLEERVARRVVVAKDTPGFIANRFGMWAMFHAIHTAERLQLTVEQVDAITGPFLGRPKSASFRLNDLVGIDVMQWIARNLIDRCPDDPHIATLATPRSMVALLERGWIGEKAGQGYYRKEGKELVVLDLQTLAYRNRQEPALPSLAELQRLPLGERIAKALALRDEVGEFLRAHLIPVLKYADYLKSEISHSVLDFDRVMMWGFGWEAGPFQMIDEIGAEHLGMDAPKFYSEGKLREFDGSYTNIRQEEDYRTIGDFQLIDQGEGYNLRDLGDGVTAVCLTTKMGVIKPDSVRALHTLLEKGVHERIVLTSEARCFSAGFDLEFLYQSCMEERWDLIDIALLELQRFGALLDQIPSVAAVYGYCLGAGLEVALSCSTIAALVETQIGLPESRVGLIPGGRGTALMRLNNQLSAKKLAEVACLLASGTLATNADQARHLGYLRSSDVTLYHPDRLIRDAKALALEARPNPTEAWKQPEGPLGGMIDRACVEARNRGELSDYDETISSKIKQVFTKPTSFEDALDWERKEFLELCSKALTQARIKHMLDTGKPLRN